jgi:hypothetical protein
MLGASEGSTPRRRSAFRSERTMQQVPLRGGAAVSAGIARQPTGDPRQPRSPRR